MGMNWIVGQDLLDYKVGLCSTKPLLDIEPAKKKRKGKRVIEQVTLDRNAILEDIRLLGLGLVCGIEVNK